MQNADSVVLPHTGDDEHANTSESTPLVGHGLKPLSKRELAISRVQFFALCWSIFLIGWNDGTIGPLLPRIQDYYDVGFATVSWIFVLGCIGIVFGAFINLPLTPTLGFGKMLVFGGSFSIVAYGLQSLRPGWHTFVLSFFIGGIGMAMQDAHANAFVALVKHNNELKMGLLHASYGLGALIAPISATLFAQTPHWSSHYWTSFGLSIINVVVLALVFRLKVQDVCLREGGEHVPEPDESQPPHKFTQILKMKATHLLALYLLTYIGVEVTIGAWTVTFMMIVRGGGSYTGYVASSFFGGLMLGRVILIPVSRKFGEVNAAYLYTVLAIAFQLVVWLVPSFTINAIAVCLIGIVLGPMYPIAMNHSGRIFPRSLVTGAIGWIAACGAAGAAALPSLTGNIAARFGIESLQPFLVVAMAFMGFFWYLVPKHPQRTT
ncbi:major facilitator superfamily domain-containing protein, partial [Crepidotus variabilis]